MTTRDDSPTVGALFNPAFTGHLIRLASAEYERVASSGLPYELAFLVAPLSLQSAARDALPGTVAGRMSNWVLRNPDVATTLADRGAALRPFVQRGIRYAMLSGSLRLEHGRLTSVGRLHRGSPATADVGECFRAAAFAGRWFARTGDSATIFAMLGARP